jgi:hypothetical protein
MSSDYKKTSRDGHHQHILRQCPNTKYKPVLVMNVHFNIYESAYVLGTGEHLPDYILNSHTIVSFHRHPRTGEPYADNLCVFRCMAYDLTKSQWVERLTAQLHDEWTAFCHARGRKAHKEVTLGNLHEAEQCFNVNFNVYEIDQHQKAVLLRYKSALTTRNYNHTINVNLYENHLSYISDMSAYCSKFKCRLCGRLFDRSNNCRRHEKVYNAATKITLPGGHHRLPKTIFDMLAEVDVHVDRDLREFPWFAVYDMESMLLKVEERSSGGKLAWTHKHQPVSASVCSDVPCYETEKFFFNSDPDTLAADLVAYLETIADRSRQLEQQRWADAWVQLDAFVVKWRLSPSPSADDSGGTTTTTTTTTTSTTTTGDEATTTATDTAAESDIDVDTDDDVDAGGDEATESSACEPPSRRFLKAIAKENTYYRSLHNL